MAEITLLQALADLPDPQSRHGHRVRKGNAPQIVAAVRNAVVHLLDEVDAANPAAALRRLNAHPEEALALLHIPPLE